MSRRKYDRLASLCADQDTEPSFIYFCGTVEKIFKFGLVNRSTFFTTKGMRVAVLRLCARACDGVTSFWA